MGFRTRVRFPPGPYNEKPGILEKSGVSGFFYCVFCKLYSQNIAFIRFSPKESFEESGYDEYVVICSPDACKECLPKDDKHYPVEKMAPGENAPPFHPNCRCSIAAYEDAFEYEVWINYLEKGGSAESWNELQKRVSDIEKTHKKQLRNVKMALLLS
ncbi:MAG: hypothetical protein Q4B73_08520 [Lachnospiraceae bacterium]|nr:hypothetical protein [Lachnospiraceae bacterium]